MSCLSTYFSNDDGGDAQAHFTVVGNICKILTVVLNAFLWDKHATSLGTIALFCCLGAGYIYEPAPLRSTATAAAALTGSRKSFGAAGRGSKSKAKVSRSPSPAAAARLCTAPWHSSAANGGPTRRRLAAKFWS